MTNDHASRQHALIATIDVGTNTALLLVSGWQDGRLVIRHDETRFVRLGEGVDSAGRIKDTAIRRLCDTLAYFKEVATREGAETIVIGATSASRDADNRDAVVETVKRETGLSYEILRGADEAFWSFRGALSGLDRTEESFLVVDIGGGSTELIRGSLQADHAAIQHAVSLDMGSVRLTERFFATLPPDPGEVARGEEWVRQMLATVPPADPAFTRLVGASGTTTSLAVLEHGWNAIPVNLPLLGEAMPLAAITRWKRRLISLNNEQVLALNPVVMAGRSDVFPAGILLLEAIMKHLEVDEISISMRGLRHGLALRYRESQYGPVVNS